MMPRLYWNVSPSPRALIGEGDRHAAIQKRQLLQPLVSVL